MTDPESGPGEAERRRPGRPRHTEPSADYLRRRGEIIEAAVEVFHAKGYETGALDDVGAALGLRKASLYYYVRSKAELLFLVFDRAISVALRDLEAISTSVPPAERLEDLIRHQVHTVASDPRLFAVFFGHRPRLSPDYEAEIRSKERRYLQFFVSAVEDGVADGTICVENPRYAAQMLLGMANWLYQWIDPSRDDPGVLADTAVSLVLSPLGLRPAKAQR